jgi:DNA-directed RNA polymerase subunit RPC12/RpoP
MKPRTKLHVQVAELSGHLPKIFESQKQWAYKECLQHKGYANKTSAFCLDCGETFSLELIKRKKAVCPHCNSKLTIEQTKARTNKQTNYFAITDVYCEFQIVRNFELIATYKKGRPVDHYLHEILQYWILPNGKITMFGLSHNSNWCMDSWSGSMEIRDGGRGWNGNKYDVYARMYHPDSEIKPEYSKYGINASLTGITFLEAIKLLPNSPKAETILKEKEYSLLQQCLSSSYNVNRYWNSIKICFRNKYKINDAGMWFDYLELLQYFKKDLRNSKYVCPKNLKAEHDKLMKKKREILRLQEIENEKLKVIKRQQKLEKAIIEYVERNKKFFDLEFTKGKISISILKSIEEFKEEGDELKHCVYTNEYYLKEKSLILSAKVDGKRAETIELRLPELKIEQARGLKNNATEHHNEIIDLVNKNLEKIRKIVIKTRPKSKEKAVA